MNGWLHRRIHHTGLHGHAHVANQRRVALLMIVTGVVRCVVWALLLVLFFLKVTAIVHLYQENSFISALSVGALLLTDWGQVAASLAQWTAGDVHADVEHVRRAQGVDFAALEGDIARLAELQPGPEATRLAEQIRARLGA